MRYAVIIVLITGFGLCTCLRNRRQGGFTKLSKADLCVTPLKEVGVCTGIRQCQTLVDLLVTQRHKTEVADYLRESVCGYDISEPKVCCPGIGGNSPREDTGTARPRTTTTTSRSPPVSEPEPDEDDEDEDEDGTVGNTILPEPGECGYVLNNNLKVVGGNNATLGEWPWVVALGYRSTKNPQGGPVFLCGGSLITNKHVLTAGHCVYNKRTLFMVRLGDLNLYEDTDGARPIDVPISAKIVHEDYNPTLFTNDIAILRLRDSVPFSEMIKPICLPLSREMRSKDFTKRRPFIAGWGTISFTGPSSAVLQTLQIPVVGENECKKSFSSFKTAVIDKRIICAGYLEGGKDACRGDSGGPLMDFDNKMALFYQIGVVSYGYKCAEPGYPGVYTRTTSFADWILQKISN